MASVQAPVRKFLKPILNAFFGKRTYLWFQLYGKLRDIRYRLVEEDEMELLPYFISDQDQVIDIGANFAYYTTRMAKLCSKGEVFAFEPILSTYWVCKKIINFFQFTNVRLYQKGVGSKTEVLNFNVPLQNIGVPSAGQAHLSVRNNDLPGSQKYYSFSKAEKMQCEVVALDDNEWCQKFSKLSFIKIDIEGAELFALQGMRNLITSHKPAILLEIVPFFLKGFNISESELEKFITNLGYKFFTYDKNTKLLTPNQTSFSDRNYILLHTDRLDDYRKLIAQEVYE